jgi:anti-sigma regulatory factor (Ser/Thr protein kinase)
VSDVGAIVRAVATPARRALTLDRPAVPHSVSQARRAVAEMLDDLDVDVWPVGLVISEAVSNVVRHAYRGLAPGRLELEVSVDDGMLTLVVADFGVGMSPDPDNSGLGIGMLMIERLVQHMDVTSTGGTRLLVRMQLAPTG